MLRHFPHLCLPISIYLYVRSHTRAGKNRAEVSAPKVAELNPYVKITNTSADLSTSLDILQDFKVLSDGSSRAVAPSNAVAGRHSHRCAAFAAAQSERILPQERNTLHRLRDPVLPTFKFPALLAWELTLPPRGLFASVFVDFGNEFEVQDPDGEEPKHTILANVTQVSHKRT